MTKEREALKLALDAFGEIAWSNETQWQRDRAKEAITAIKEALAQPEQEPVAMKFKIYKPTVPDPTRQDINNALLPWVYDQDRSSGFAASMWVTPVATLPPQRTWVGLTELEQAEIVNLKWWDWEDTFDIDGFVRAIESKLKEKNHG